MLRNVVLAVAGLALVAAGSAAAQEKAAEKPQAKTLAPGTYAHFVTNHGEFKVRLMPDKAPNTVANFVGLAQGTLDPATGKPGKSKPYYNGLTFHRIAPNFVVQGGSPGANEYVGTARYMRDEVGLPHLRGAVGISTRGRDRGDAQIFVNLVDNPRFDHEYTVFAQVLNGMEVVDRILEGDVIDDVEILP